MKKGKLEPREVAQVCAALRLFGRMLENGTDPALNPMVARRFGPDCLPMDRDEIDTLIGRLDGTWTARGLRPWDAWRDR
jgi:hypothetical protein